MDMSQQSSQMHTDAPGTQPGGQKMSSNNDTLLSVLSYIGPLVIVSYIMPKKSPTVIFHVKQGVVLLVIEIAVWFIGMLVWMLWPLLQIVNVATLVLSIIGIVNAVGGKMKELPLVGRWSRFVPL
jgi:uncharacterized membrane protein